jgi:hypothetical protein
MGLVPIVVGTTLASRYDILQQIGAGGMGEVYRARDRQLDELVARDPGPGGRLGLLCRPTD